MKPFFVYILSCNDDSFYVGHTDNLEKRLSEHEDGSYGGYTCKRRPVRLVFSCEFFTRDEALERERQIKGWSRSKKKALIRGDWDTIHKLSISHSRPSTPLRANGLGKAPYPK